MAEAIIIDAHMHLFHSSVEGQRAKEDYEIWEYGDKADVCFGKYGGDPEDAIKAMKDAGASKAVVVHLFVAEAFQASAISGLNADIHENKKHEEKRTIKERLGEELKRSNAWVCGVARKYPQLVPFICVDPCLLSIKETEAHIREMVENQGAKGIKVHPEAQGFYMNDERMLQIIRACVDFKLPIVTHSGPSRSGDSYAEPRTFTEVLKTFPDLCLVLAHMGGGSWGQLREVAREFTNAVFDCSEIIEWTGSVNGPSDRELAQLILDVGPERVMMGTDFPWYDIDHNVRQVMELPLLSEEQKKDILGANAIRILNL